MGTVTSQITSLSIIYSTVWSGADQTKHQQSFAPLAFARGFHRWPANFPHKGPATRKIFPFDAVIMIWSVLLLAHLNHVCLVIQQYLYRWICYPNSPEYVLLMSHECHGPSCYPRLDCVFNCLFQLTKEANETPHNWLFVRRYYTDDLWSPVKRTINYRTLSYCITASCWLSRYIVHFKGYAVGTDLNSWMIFLYYMPFRCGMNIMNILWALQNHMTFIQNLHAFV